MCVRTCVRACVCAICFSGQEFSHTFFFFFFFFFWPHLKGCHLHVLISESHAQEDYVTLSIKRQQSTC